MVLLGDLEWLYLQFKGSSSWCFRVVLFGVLVQFSFGFRVVLFDDLG